MRAWIPWRQCRRTAETGDGTVLVTYAALCQTQPAGILTRAWGVCSGLGESVECFLRTVAAPVDFSQQMPCFGPFSIKSQGLKDNLSRNLPCTLSQPGVQDQRQVDEGTDRRRLQFDRPFEERNGLRITTLLIELSCCATTSPCIDIL